MKKITVKNIRRYMTLLLLLSVTVFLQACIFGGNGYIHNRSDDYQHATSQPSLVLPKDSKLNSIKPAYHIPSVAKKSASQQPNIIPPGFVKPIKHTVSKRISVRLVKHPSPKLIVNANISHSIKLITKAIATSKWSLVNSDPKNGVLVIKDPKKGEMYLLQASSIPSATVIEVYDQTSNKVAADVAERILTMLEHNS